MKPATLVSISVAIAAVLIVSTLAATATGPFAFLSHAGSGGRAVMVRAVATDPGGAADPSKTGATATTPVSGATITIFSPLPSTLGVGSEQAEVPGDTQTTIQNATELLLYEGVSNGAGIASGSLSSAFSEVIAQWATAGLPPDSQVSLLLQGTYVVTNNETETAAIYTYVDFVSLNPFDVPGTIQATAVFDLAQPAEVVALNSTTSASIPIGVDETTCNPPAPLPPDAWTTNYDSTTTGPFPLLFVNNTLRSSDGDPIVAASEDVLSQSLSFGFTGAEGASNGYVNMTQGASYSTGNLKGDANSAAVAALADSEDSVGVIYLTDVTLDTLRQTEAVYHYIDGDCAVAATDFEFVTIYVTGMGTESNGDYFWGATLNSTYGAVMAHYISANGANVAGTDALDTGTSEEWLTMQDQASGYSNLASLYNDLLGDVGLFTSTLGLDLSIMDAASLSPFGLGEGVDVADTVDLVNSAVGFGATILAEVSSISFSASVSDFAQLITVTADTGPVDLQVWEASGLTELVASDGKTAEADMPLAVYVTD